MQSAVDWSRHWLGSVLDVARRLGLTDSTLPPAMVLERLNDGARAMDLRNVGGKPIHFVPQSALPPGVAYEAFIGDTGGVPTRDNLHDFFNALVWLAFPRLKQQLNKMQAEQIAASGVGKERGPTRDGVTLFDENGALLVLHDCAAMRALLAALRDHQWQVLFEQRAAFGPQAQLWLVGHAAMEKLVAPRKAITVHTRVLWVDAGFFALDEAARLARIDQETSAELARDGISPNGFTPLQVLGIPGWWPGQGAAFYQDASVFRPKRGAAAESPSS